MSRALFRPLPLLALCATLLVACAPLGTPASNGGGAKPAAQEKAEKKDVVVSALGSLQEAFDQYIGPEFEKATGNKLTFVPKGVSTEVIAMAKAEKDNPQVDVIHLDEGPGYEGIDLGLYESLDPKIVTNLTDMYDIARLPGDPAVISRVSVLGMMYHTEIFAKNNWKAPTSWSDLFRPELKGHVLLAHSSTTFGPITLIQFAKMNGGDIKNIDPGFKKMAELAPNVLSYERTSNRYGELFQAGEAHVGVWSDVGTSILKKSGVPVEFAFPQDGGYLLGGMLAAIKNSPNPKGAQELINFMLDPKVQAYIAETRGFGPLNKKTELKPETAREVVNGSEQMSKLQRVDWTYLNTVRPQWTERMAKEVESISAR